MATATAIIISQKFSGDKEGGGHKTKTFQKVFLNRSHKKFAHGLCLIFFDKIRLLDRRRIVTNMMPVKSGVLHKTFSLLFGHNSCGILPPTFGFN